ncbi:peptidoglycan-binding domain-containing protein [Cellulomonas sp. C5510]|uniref:peptidoglycan recognition protein family protein n=1 Tax=Cellulomonas sp. C5510 TaxID=2871170 RepID=UPI001C94729C|nr:peptidoglycan-binding domain-containing protein [Cellulomonas sp. C5510]QZN86602.1 N-acetylmuramoyl-L-alanine amidase [Cellulomonas sp. C5510]
MARYPGATWRPLPTSRLSGARMAAYNRVNLHVTAGIGSPFGVFDRPGAASSHFYVAKSGAVEQFVDTGLRAEADLDGNDATISVETEGGHPAAVANSEPWTAAQVESIARLYAWTVTTHGIALRMATSSALGEASRGLSWHRLGVDGAFPALPSVLAGRTQRGGGMRYSTVRGKVCPGDAKIQQIGAVLDRARELLRTQSTTSAPAPAPAPVAPGVPAPPYPLPAGHCFGPRSGPVWQHSGFFDHREHLRTWQARMRDRGWAIDPDGLYGAQTAATTRAFQAEKGLTVDALIGPVTWAAAWTAPITP